MTVLSPSSLSVVTVLTAAMLMTGCVVYGSPTDQDKQLWSDHNGPLSWAECSECTLV